MVALLTCFLTMQTELNQVDSSGSPRMTLLLESRVGIPPLIGYGPYDFGPGEDVQIVVVEGMGGISVDATIRIGRAFKLGGMTSPQTSFAMMQMGTGGFRRVPLITASTDGCRR